jgi:hypothetical protein
MIVFKYYINTSIRIYQYTICKAQVPLPPAARICPNVDSTPTTTAKTHASPSIMQLPDGRAFTRAE